MARAVCQLQLCAVLSKVRIRCNAVHLLVFPTNVRFSLCPMPSAPFGTLKRSTCYARRTLVGLSRRDGQCEDGRELVACATLSAERIVHWPLLLQLRCRLTALDRTPPQLERKRAHQARHVRRVPHVLNEFTTVGSPDGGRRLSGGRRSASGARGEEAGEQARARACSLWRRARGGDADAMLGHIQSTLLV